MNRRSFVSSLLAGLASALVVFKSKADTKPTLITSATPDPSVDRYLEFDSKMTEWAKDVAQGYSPIECRGGVVQVRPGAKVCFTIPPEAGRFISMEMVNGKIVMAMENGVWISDAPFKSCRKLTA